MLTASMRNSFVKLQKSQAPSLRKKLNESPMSCLSFSDAPPSLLKLSELRSSRLSQTSGLSLLNLLNNQKN